MLLYMFDMHLLQHLVELCEEHENRAILVASLIHEYRVTQIMGLIFI